MTRITDIADAVVLAINEARLSAPLVAVRVYAPSHELTELDVLRVSVVPRAKRTTMLDRTRRTREFDIDVGVQKRFATDVLAPPDDLLSLVEEIDDHFASGRTLPTPATQARWVRNSHEPVYVPEHWDEMRLFTSVLTLTWRVDC